MKKKILFSTLFLVAASACVSIWWYLQTAKYLPSSLPQVPEVSTTAESKPTFRPVSFNELPGWHHAQLRKSLQAFQISCQTFIKQDPEQVAGTDSLELRAKDWQPVCHAALKIKPVNAKNAREFFLNWFQPVEFHDKEAGPGLFTGYYVPAIKGSTKRTAEFKIPLYETPDDLITSDLGMFFNDLKSRRIVGRLEKRKLVPYYTRAQINKGVLKDKAKVVAWINSPIDRLFLEIQGSGVIEMDQGKTLSVGYDAQNGWPYTAIAGVLIKQGIMTKDNASMQAIKRYLTEHPEQMNKVINKNKSFVFFRKMQQGIALGSQGVPLTPGYSMAVDRQWIPMGTPLWLNTTRPDSKDPDVNKPMHRLMIAQDTGGAIRGKVRGDVFWGGGEHATLIAGHMKNPGKYWLLLPKHVTNKINSIAKN